MNQLLTVGDTIMLSLQRFFYFLPALLGAAILLILGWFVAKAVAKLLEKGLEAVGFETAAESSGISRFVRRSGSTRTTSSIVSQLAKWFVFLVFVQAAANALAMPQLTNLINNIVLFIPNVIVAVAIVVVAAIVAEFLSGIVQGLVREVGGGSPRILGALTRYAVIGLGVVAALDQMGIARNVVNTVMIAFVGSIALAFGLAFGLGGREVAAKITSSWYDSGTEAAARWRENERVRERNLNLVDRDVA